MPSCGSILYRFRGGTDGYVPFAGLLMRDDALYGTTLLGGNATTCNISGHQGCGTVFRIRI